MAFAISSRFLANGRSLGIRWLVCCRHADLPSWWRLCLTLSHRDNVLRFNRFNSLAPAIPLARRKRSRIAIRWRFEESWAILRCFYVAAAEWSAGLAFDWLAFGCLAFNCLAGRFDAGLFDFAWFCGTWLCCILVVVCFFRNEVKACLFLYLLNSRDCTIKGR